MDGGIISQGCDVLHLNLSRASFVENSLDRKQSIDRERSIELQVKGFGGVRKDAPRPTAPAWAEQFPTGAMHLFDAYDIDSRRCLIFSVG